MKRISLLALALSTIATMAVSEDYFEGGILWTTFAPQIANEIAVTERDLYRTDASTLNDNENSYTGNDRDRVNSVPPLIAWEGGIGKLPTHDRKLLAMWESEDKPSWQQGVDRRFAPVVQNNYEEYGAWVWGSHKYQRELTKSLAYAPAEDNFIRFEEPIEIYSDVGKINKLPLPYGDVPNKIEAKGILVADSEKLLAAEFRGVDTENCQVEFRVNGSPIEIEQKKDRFVSPVAVKKGKNTFKVVKSCSFYNYISSFKSAGLTTVEPETPIRFRLKNLPKVYGPGYQITRENIGGLAFRFINLDNGQSVTTIKNSLAVKTQQPLEIHYSEAEKADPVLWSWIGNHYSYFTGPDQVQLDEKDQSIVQPTPLQANLANMELIKQDSQDILFSQALNARKNMFKGTFYPKTPGIYEVLVVKKTNISAYFYTEMHEPWGGGGIYAYPIYSLAFDNSRPVGHSIARDGHSGNKPIEYDWFWFEVDEDDVKYGMDMSLLVHGNTGLLSLLDRKRIKGDNVFDRPGREGHFLLDNQTKEHIETNKAQSLGIKASQKIGFYIKPARATKFRAFQQSDFAKIDGSTSKHGHDIDGSSEGRINGLNTLDRSEDQPLKDDMELLGGFD